MWVAWVDFSLKGKVRLKEKLSYKTFSFVYLTVLT